MSENVYVLVNEESEVVAGPAVMSSQSTLDLANLEAAQFGRTWVSRDTAGLIWPERLGWPKDLVLNASAPLTLADLQAEQKPWVAHNFGDRPAHHPLMGAIEEIGETSTAYLRTSPQDIPAQHLLVLAMAAWLGQAAHGVLKTAQGIRGDATTHRVKITVALMKIVEDIDELDWRVNAPKDSPRLGNLDLPAIIDPSVADGVADTVIYLSDFCSAAGIDLQEAVQTTWEKVRQRDWKADKDKGGA